MIILASIALVLLVNVLHLFREKRLRRLAAARLEVVKTVSEMEKMMLERKLCAGDLCHDKFHKRMLAVQYGEHFGINWGAFFSKNRSPEWEHVKKRIHKEIRQDTELGKLLRRYLYAAFAAYSNEKPFSVLLFWAWVIIRSGGLLMLLACLVAYIKAIYFTENALAAIKKQRNEFKINALEVYGASRLQEG